MPVVNSSKSDPGKGEAAEPSSVARPLPGSRAAVDWHHKTVAEKA